MEGLKCMMGLSTATPYSPHPVVNLWRVCDVECVMSSAEVGRRKRFCVFASPTRKQFDNAKHEDRPLLKMMILQKTLQLTDAKFRDTGVSDIS